MCRVAADATSRLELAELARGPREARTWHLCELASSPAAGTSTILCGRNRHVTSDLVAQIRDLALRIHDLPAIIPGAHFSLRFCLDLLPCVLDGSCAATLLLDSEL